MLLDFSKRTQNANHRVNISDPEFLPFINPGSTALPFNWGDAIVHGAANPSPKYFTKDLCLDLKIMKGIHRGFNAIVKWEKKNIKKFIKKIVFDPTLVNDLYQVLVDRQKKILSIYSEYIEHVLKKLQSDIPSTPPTKQQEVKNQSKEDASFRLFETAKSKTESNEDFKSPLNTKLSK